MSTQIVMLGTGTPWPDPRRSGPATAIIVDGAAYLVDFGPGVVRRLSAAFEKGVSAVGFGGVNIATAFLTHLHSDHTAGLPDPDLLIRTGGEQRLSDFLLWECAYAELWWRKLDVHPLAKQRAAGG